MEKTMYDCYRMREGIIENLPDAVLCPRSREEIEILVPYCVKKCIPVTVYGGGSSVTRGVEPVKGGISPGHAAEFQQNGFILRKEPDYYRGGRYVRTCSGRGSKQGPPNFSERRDPITCGHFPQSYEYSSVGGWVVTRGSGTEFHLLRKHKGYRYRPGLMQHRPGSLKATVFPPTRWVPISMR